MVKKMMKRRTKWMSLLMLTSTLVPQAWAQSEPSTEGVEEIVVQGRFIPSFKKSTSEISSEISTEDFSIQGDTDVASSLRRVTGLSLSQGKFVVVRGLNERYSSVTINGSPLPSPEPLRRIAPLDLIPTSVIDKILVQKTFSPEYSGEMGGGFVEMRTKVRPDEDFLEISGSTGMISGTTFEDGLTYDGSDGDWTGFDDGLRNLPKPLAEIFWSQRVGNSMTPAQQQAIGRSLVNSPLWVMQEGQVPPNVSFGAQAGKSWEKNNIAIGVIGSAGYDSSWVTKEGTRAEGEIGPGGVLAERQKQDLRSTENEIGTNGFLSVGLDIMEDHEIKAMFLGVRSTSKEARSEAGFDASEGTDVRIDNLEWFERQVWISQLQGTHWFPNQAVLDWRASYSEAFRDAPYQREVLYEWEVDRYRYKGTLDANTTRFSKIEDTSKDLGINLEFPITSLAVDDLRVKVGYSNYSKERDAWLRQFSFEPGSIGIPQALLYSRIDYIFADQNINDNRLRLVETGGVLFPEAYTGELDVSAFYAGLDTQFNPNWRLSVGFRSESSDQTVDTFNRTLPDNGLTETRIGSDYILPAATVTLTFGDNMQIRAGYSETIVRPQFRELAFAQFINTETDMVFQGNPFLKNTEMDNFDARWEKYFDRGEFLTIGAFYKRLENPIEEFALQIGDGIGTAFINAPSAKLYGMEFEFQKGLPVHEWLNWKWSSSKDFFFKSNYTFTESEVSDDGQVTLAQGSVGGGVVPSVRNAAGFVADGRDLQGLSAHLLNLQVGYDDYEARSRLTFLLNFTSERTRAVEDLGSNLPAIMEKVPTSLDVVYARTFTIWDADYEFGFKAKNLFGEDYEATQERGDVKINFDTYDVGRAYSVSLRRRF